MVLEASTGRRLAAIERPGVFSPDARWLLRYSGDVAELWDVAKSEIAAEFALEVDSSASSGHGCGLLASGDPLPVDPVAAETLEPRLSMDHGRQQEGPPRTRVVDEVGDRRAEIFGALGFELRGLVLDESSAGR